MRVFFKEAVHPSFHSSKHIQNYFKENVRKAYQDAAEAWNEEEIR
ncbi:DUF6434 domain-containing protein [Domibacillus epiphyticus]|nr:DUF6434 domain-containing protein [Domibacillus epiphyticus]